MLMSVIFDMDGVIVDSYDAHMGTWKAFFLSLEKSVTDADLDFVRQGRKRQEILRHFLGNLKDDEIQALCRKKDALFANEAQSVAMIPGVRDLLEELKRAAIPTAVASCGSTARVHQLLSRLRLRSYFTAVVTGDEVLTGKPDPEIFYKAARQIKAHPAESIVFEDSVSGVQGAKPAGMNGVGIAARQHTPVSQQEGRAHGLPLFPAWAGSNIKMPF